MKRRSSSAPLHITKQDQKIVVIPSLPVLGNGEQQVKTKTRTRTTAPKRPYISKTFKDAVWDKYIGDSIAKALCFCCEKTEIRMTSFVCGHVIAVCKGGELHIDNLRPICSECNLSMGTQNLFEFKVKLMKFNSQKAGKGKIQIKRKPNISSTVNKTELKSISTSDTNNNYVCPRCNYSTYWKSHMINHFQRKTACINKNDITLTDEIKEIVLKDHVYHLKKDPPQSTTIVNNYNQQQNIMNIIGQMDTYDKLDKLLDHTNRTIHDFRFSVEEKIEPEIKKMDSYCNYQIDQTTILGMIDDISRVKPEETEKMNILFDKKLNSVRMFINHKWQTYWLDAGVIELMKIIKESYLDTYETYLIGKIYDYDIMSSNNDGHYINYLHEYYRFIINFNLLPYVCECDLTDKELIGRELDEHNPNYLERRFRREYNDLKKTVKKTEIMEMRKHVVNILKRNSIQNTDQLNRDIFGIMQMDDEFKQKILEP